MRHFLLFTFENAEVFTFLLLWILAPLFFIFFLQLCRKISIPLVISMEVEKENVILSDTKKPDNIEKEIRVNKNEANA